MNLFFCEMSKRVQGCERKFFGGTVRLHCVTCFDPCQARYAKVEMHPCRCGGQDVGKTDCKTPSKG
jgi:hypothetical protein